MKSHAWLTLMGKEMADAIRNRWFLAFAAIFTILILAFTGLGLSLAGQYGVTGFGRTAANLVNLVMLVVPLMGMLLGSMSMAGEREGGVLLYLYSHPVSLSEIFFGKLLGVGMALCFSLLLGFGLAGLYIGIQTGVRQITAYLGLVVLSLLLLGFGLSFGLLLSCWARRSAAAVGGALFAWLILVFLGDLGLMGSAIFFRLPIQSFLWFSLLNPLQVFKTAAVLVIQGNLEILGPAGVYAERMFGHALLPLLIGILFFWNAAFIAAGPWVLKRKGVLP